MCHFIPLVDTDVVSVTRAYVEGVARLHGFPESIVADRDPRWTSKFWSELQKSFGTELRLSSAFHP